MLLRLIFETNHDEHCVIDTLVVISDAKILYSSIRTAFKLDMKNGNGENFLMDVAAVFATIFERPYIIKYFAPVYGHGSNTEVQYLFVQHLFVSRRAGRHRNSGCLCVRACA